MRGRNRVLIAFIVLILFMYINVNQVDGSNFMIAEENGENVLSLDNASISIDLFSTYLEVGFTRFQFGLNVVVDNVTLFLSLDNVSWVEIGTQAFNIDNGFCNGTGIFRIVNSLVQPFPFDVEQNETLYIYLERELWQDGFLGSCVYHTAAIALVVTHAIIRSWIFTIDWTIPSIFGAIFLCISIVFLMSRHHRLQIERRSTESED